MLQTATGASPQLTPISPQIASSSANLQSPSFTSLQPETKATTRTKPRLPPTLDSSLVSSAHTARNAFSQALADDQRAALQPNYFDSFQSANDVVKRLLPYHVWDINEDDLQWALQGSKNEASTSYGMARKRHRDDEQCYPSREEAYSIFARYSKISAHAKKLRLQLTGGTRSSTSEEAEFSRESLYNIEKLAVEQEKELLALEQENLRQAKESAIEAGVKWEELMRLGPTFNQQAVSGSLVSGQDHSATGTAKTGQAPNSSSTKATENSPFSPISFQKSVGTIQGNAATANSNRPSTILASTYNIANDVAGSPSAPMTPKTVTVKGSKPRGRPRKNRDEDGKIIPTTTPTTKVAPPHQKKDNPPSTATASTKGSTSGAAEVAKQGQMQSHTVPASSAFTPASVRLPPPKPVPSPAPPRPATVIPSHPIPLVLPLSTLARLSSLGIAPIPAPHLLPAINAQQARAQRPGHGQGASTPAIAISQSIHSTAPRPAPSNQAEPALLMGITEAPLPRSTLSSSAGGKSATSTQQMLHVSVVLSKLSPSQLSGLAALMQSLQNTGAEKAGGNPSIGDSASSGNGGSSNHVRKLPSGPTPPATSTSQPSPTLLPSNNASSTPNAASE
jgi:hypothetical protein